MSFDSFQLHPDILRGIKAIGFVLPTPVQLQAIPPIMAGRDVIASAQTGTGKTAAFVLPILHRLLSKPAARKGLRTLILSPTRELAVQSMEHLGKLSQYVPLRGYPIYGGVPMQPQIRALQQGLDIVSATPGRLLDHVYEGRIDFGALEIFVLDEADRMMDMGFLPDIRRVISLLPPKRQNLVFSATIPDEIMKLASGICREPVIVRIKPQQTTAAGIRHAVYPVPEPQKTELLLRLLNDNADISSVIVFTRTKIRADRLGQSLKKAGIRVEVIHGDRSQGQRDRALDRFRAGHVQVLVATDVAARGIDVKDISHVINFDLPSTPEDYIHRAGRTARAEATGDAFSLVTPDQEPLITEIERVINQRLPRVTLPDFQYRKHAPAHPHRPGHPARPAPHGGGPRRGHFDKRRPPHHGGHHHRPHR